MTDYVLDVMAEAGANRVAKRGTFTGYRIDDGSLVAVFSTDMDEYEVPLKRAHLMAMLEDYPSDPPTIQSP